MSEELKPCPFCGGDANAQPQTQHLPGCYFDALAQLKAAPRGDLSMVPEVLKAWNRRHDDKRVAELEAELAEAIEWLQHFNSKAAVAERRNSEGVVTDTLSAFLARHGEKS